MIETIDKSEKTKLIGDSIVRRQLLEFCGRVPNCRKRYCIPEAGLEDITAAFEDATKDVTNDTHFVIHAGTNDVQRTKSEDLLNKYWEMIRRYKSKSSLYIILNVCMYVCMHACMYVCLYDTG